MGRCDYFEKECDNNSKCNECLNHNKPDMREKVKEYISELDVEYDRSIDQAESILAAIGDYDEKPMPSNYVKLIERAQTLNEAKSDLESRFEELV